METHSDLSDEAFEQQLEACTLPPAIFNHEAHLRLAWIHIRKYGTDQAVGNVCRQLIHYVNSLGARDKYNQTLTVAAVRAVSHFINRSDTDSFYDFIHQFPRLKSDFRALLATHYQLDIYNSDLAKRTYIEPDLLPFS
ncbi:hypothetical protein [Spirosoma aerolatum]|uniref:hypothetical protein n=1 Tax=Spirosoma aerolatum TaxID=1211326 RepID=UPI0009AEF3A7|nr:hypothetical protein [Spirosoma aerolatum]